MSCPRCSLRVPTASDRDETDICPRCLAETGGALSVMLSPEGGTRRREDRGALRRLMRSGHRRTVRNVVA